MIRDELTQDKFGHDDLTRYQTIDKFTFIIYTCELVTNRVMHDNDFSVIKY